MFKNRFLLVLGLLSLLLVAMAVSRAPAKAPRSAELSWPPRPVIVSAAEDLAIQRGQEADVARWNAISESFQNLAIDEAAQQRSQEADSARWTSIAEHYIPRGRIADALRWTAIAEHYMQLTSTSR